MANSGETTRKVVFIIGPGHCGSTLLDLILGSHSRAFSLGEFWSLTRKMRAGEFVEPICGICGRDCAFWNDKASLTVLQSYFRWGSSDSHRSKRFWYNRFGNLRINVYQRLFEWTGASMLVDSSKNPALVRRQLRPFWFWREITPWLVYIHRDGRAVVNSYLCKYPERGVASLTKEWVDKTLALEHYFESFAEDRRLKVSYEALATNPEAITMMICQQLNISYEHDMLCYWRHQHHIIHGNASTRSLIVKFREQLGSDPAEHSLQVDQETDPIGQVSDEELGLAIKLDMRWQQELDQEQLTVFNSIGGEVNESYAYDPQ